MAEPEPPLILGLWDGHDSGAALVQGDRILAAVNEERLSRRKLEVAFPRLSVRECLRMAGRDAAEVSCVALSTTDPAKTLTRLFPSLKESYYQFRRRLKGRPGTMSEIKRAFKYKFTELAPGPLSRALSSWAVRSPLGELGLPNAALRFVDHHQAHAATAAFLCGFDRALIATLDGVGDGLSGTIQKWENGRLDSLTRISSRDSLGIFYEQATTLLNMRELEDEGKVMALSSYAYPVPDERNPLLDFFKVEGLALRSAYPQPRFYRALSEVCWRFSAEKFAYMVQRTLEVKLLELLGNALARTGIKRLALAGGVASNIKANRLIENLPGLDGLFVFPHMGDGGQALGSALWANHELQGVSSYHFRDVFLGPSYEDREIRSTLDKSGLHYEKLDDVAARTAERLAQGDILFWFQGRMEYGPRALGHRSILALPGSSQIKDRLNLVLKKRVWYQPFCPSILEENASLFFSDRPPSWSRFMTTSYSVRPEKIESLSAVVHVDGTCRAQIVSAQDDPLYHRLLCEMKRLTGLGALLNTSLNVHGEPLVCSPKDAVETFLKARPDGMVLGYYWVAAARD